MRTKIALVAAALLPSLAFANGYDVPTVTPRDLALVESAVAAQNDAGATYALPAALSRVRGLSLNVGGSMLNNSTKWAAPAGSAMAGSPDATTKFSPATPVAAFAAYGLDVGGHGLGVGLGLNVVAGGNMHWDDAWAGRGHIITVERRVYGSYLTAGVEVIPGLRAGGGLVYYYTTEYLKQGVQPDPSSFGELSTKGGAASFDASLEYTPPLPAEPLTFAVDYKHKAAQTLTGDGNFVVPPALLLPGTNPPPVSQGVTHELTYPNVLNVGLAYRPPVRGLQLTGVYTLTRYSVYGTDTFVGDKGTVIAVPRNYGDGHTFRVGAEYETTPRLTLRVGVLRDLSGFKTDTYDPTIPDGNTWAGGLGATWKFTPDFSVSGAFFYAVLDQVNTTGTTALPGQYNTNVYIVSLGLNYRVDLMGR